MSASEQSRRDPADTNRRRSSPQQLRGLITAATPLTPFNPISFYIGGIQLTLIHGDLQRGAAAAEHEALKSRFISFTSEDSSGQSGGKTNIPEDVKSEMCKKHNINNNAELLGVKMVLIDPALRGGGVKGPIHVKIIDYKSGLGPI